MHIHNMPPHCATFATNSISDHSSGERPLYIDSRWGTLAVSACRHASAAPHYRMSDRTAVIEANRAFYQAFESLDLDNMERIWLRDAKIVCIHPGWRRLSGWGPIMNSWERIFESAFEMKFEVNEVDVIVSGDLAVVVTEENLTQRGYDGVVRAQVLASNVFERVGQRWWIVLHHGSPVMQPTDDEPPLQ
jgi:ketosteroid isomerase-like protein